MKQYYFLLLLTLILIPFIQAVPPTTVVQDFEDGYVIVESMQTALKLNKNHSYNFFLYNKSTGQEIDNTSIDCSFYLSDRDGFVIYSDNATYNDDNYWHIEIDGDYFNQSGEYSYGVNCQNTYGGSLSGLFYVTESGVYYDEARAKMGGTLLFILFLFMAVTLFLLFYTEHYIAKFAFYWVTHVLFVLVTFAGWQVGVEGMLKDIALTGIFRTLFFISTIAIFPLLILSIAWIVYIHTYNEHMQKMIDKGEDPETAFRLTKRKKKGWFHGM